MGWILRSCKSGRGGLKTAGVLLKNCYSVVALLKQEKIFCINNGEV